MTRHFWVLLHRYAGLAMAGFLIIVGLTGSLLAFQTELNRALTPHLFPATRPAQTMGLGELALATQSVLPEADVTRVYVDSTGAAIVGFEPRLDPATDEPYELGFNELFLDAGTGRELGRRTVGGLPTGLDNLMPFIYRLHYNLSLGPVGRWILGITALVWTIDGFVAFYLTLPAGRTVRNPVGCAMRTANVGNISDALPACRSGSLSLWERVRVFFMSVYGFVSGRKTVGLRERRSHPSDKALC